MLSVGPLGALGATVLMLAGAAQELSLPSKDVQAKDVQAKDVQGWVDQWAEFIRPSADELSYESIGWRNEFWPAVQLAQELGRPILLWTMNGHPLGCT